CRGYASTSHSAEDRGRRRCLVTPDVHSREAIRRVEAGPRLPSRSAPRDRGPEPQRHEAGCTGRLLDRPRPAPRRDLRHRAPVGGAARARACGGPGRAAARHRGICHPRGLGGRVRAHGRAAQPLDPYRTLDTARVRLFALPDTTPVRLDGVWTGAAYDSIQARARSVADSLRRASDTTAHPGAPPAAAQRAPAAGRAPGAPSGLDTTRARPDTSRIRQLLRQRPAPSDRFVARAVTRLTPGAQYLVRVRRATNPAGAAADGQAVLQVPKPAPSPPARDTTRARPGAKPP